MLRKRRLIKRILKDERVSFVVTTKQKNFMVEQAERNGIALAEFVREAVLKDFPKK